MPKAIRITLSSLEDAKHLDAIFAIIETEPRRAKKELNKLFHKIVQAKAHDPVTKHKIR